MRIFKLFILVALIFNFSLAQAKCVGRFVNPLSHICWSCIFPISIGDTKISSQTREDTKNPTSPLCSCMRPPSPIPVPGITLGFWEPIALIDVTRTPYCMVNLGGMQLMKDQFHHGSVSSDYYRLTEQSFYHTHYYKYPITWALELLTDLVCMEKGSIFDIAYMSEFDPLWNDDELAAILSPENAAFANIAAQTSCSADCLASSKGLGRDELHWCAGCNGSMMPFSGHVSFHNSGLQASTLLSARLISKMHRQLMLPITSTSKLKEVCEVTHGMKSMTIKKSQYKLQLTYPKANAKGKHACNPLGRGQLFWQSAIEFPVKGEDFGYLVWRKRNCCAF